MRFGRWLNSAEKNIIANVRNHGCHINIVSPSEDEEGVPFAYSVGFAETVGQPEVIVFGLPGNVLGSVINETLQRCREGLELQDGAEVHGVLEGHKLIARQVQPDFIVPDYLNSAIWYQQYRTGRALEHVVQLVWPGPDDGLFPWDDVSDESVRHFQPALYQPSLHQ